LAEPHADFQVDFSRSSTRDRCDIAPDWILAVSQIKAASLVNPEFTTLNIMIAGDRIQSLPVISPVISRSRAIRGLTLAFAAP
jgi:hypothetical protein